MEHGAESVVILPIARVLDLTFWKAATTPYIVRVEGDAREPFDMARWPRGE